MYVELGYPIYEEMPLYPGLPKVQMEYRDSIDKGDGWNGTVLSMYLHAGTHADAPIHYVNGAKGIDEIPITSFIYNKPLVITVPWKENYLITVEDLLAYGDVLYEADLLIFNTGHYVYRDTNFDIYKDNFPAVSPEAAEYIRKELLSVKAVAIDTLSIENLTIGGSNGYRTHNAFLNPNRFTERTIVVIEDYNPKPIVGKKVLRAYASPLRIIGRDACPINVIAEIEDIV